MIILGIDPGTAASGFGIIEATNNNFKAKEYGCIKTSSSEPMAERLSTLYQGLKKIIKKFNPNVIAVEQVFFSKNVKTALSIGQARGVALLASAQEGIPLFEYTPLQVKIAVSGYGRADKSQVQKMVRVLLKMDEIPKPDDAADGLAIALCHGFSAKYASLV
jgi:crossover junction endodeoxyribonuclease RuvC